MAMNRVFIDTNVAIDLIVFREPYYSVGRHILAMAKMGSIKLMVSSCSIPNLIYFSTYKYKLSDPAEGIWSLLQYCNIVNTYKSTISEALKSNFRDKEDASEYFTALDNHADYFITRNLKDYKSSLSPILPVYSPTDFLHLMSPNTIFASPVVK
jgi:predicted nucleic acid-binding protein